jgi:hypothetical protein
VYFILKLLLLTGKSNNDVFEEKGFGVITSNIMQGHLHVPQGKENPGKQTC